MKSLCLFLGLHLLFTADDVAGIDAPTYFIHRYSKTTDAALVDIAPLHTLLGDLLCRLLLNHDFLPYVENDSLWFKGYGDDASFVCGLCHWSLTL